MKNKKLRYANYGLALLGLLITAALYSRLPQQIPTHWSLDGTVTYSGKITIWPLAGLMLLFALLFDFMPYLDPRKKNYQKFSGYYDSFCIVMQLFLMMMLAITLSESINPGKVSVGRVVTAFLGLLFMFIGNMLPKVKSNFYMGIKTPWTLSDEEIWRRTNRFGGKILFYSGALIVLSGWLLEPIPMAAALFTLIAAGTLLPCLMSYIWWRKRYGK